MATTCRLRPQPSSHYTHFSHSSGLEAWLSLKGPTSVPQAHDSTPWPGEMPHCTVIHLPIRGHPDSRVTPAQAQTTTDEHTGPFSQDTRSCKPRNRQNGTITSNRHFTAVRMIEVRNPMRPRDAASDTSLRISYPIPQASLPYTIHKGSVLRSCTRCYYLIPQN